MHRPKTFDPPWIDFFTRPCPYQIKQWQSFPQFSRLPKELQLAIWKYAAIPEPRQITIRSIHRPKPVPNSALLSSVPFNDEYKDMKCIVTAPIPGVLHACADSREEGLKMYYDLGSEFFGHNIFINFDLDILVFADRYSAKLFVEKDQGFTGAEDFTFMDSIKYVAISQDSQVTREDVEWYCSRYFSLLHLAISASDDVYATLRPTPFPETWFPESNKVLWGNMGNGIYWKRTDWLETAHQSQLSSLSSEESEPLDDWFAPVITIGSEMQWAALSELGVDKTGWVIGTNETWGSKSGLHLTDLESHLN